MDGAGAALGDAAAIFGADQAQMVAQYPQKRRRGIDIVTHHALFAIDLKMEHFASDGFGGGILGAFPAPFKMPESPIPLVFYIHNGWTQTGGSAMLGP